MSDAIPASALSLVASWFDASTVRSALAHAENDRVHVVKPPPWPVVARVTGGQGYVVTVDYRAGGNQLRGECSCAVGTDCEHAAATALVVFAREREYAAQRVAAARQAVVGDWLADFGRDDPRAGAPAPTDRCVAYVIDARDGELGLTAMQCTRLKRGGLSTGTVLGALGDPQRGAPRWVAIDDLRRIALLRAVTRAAPQSTKLGLGRVHGELLRELAGSGQLFWESTHAAPLSWGPAVTEPLCWRSSPAYTGAFRLGLASHLVIAPARECHYIDPVGGVIGPLDLGIPAELVARLVTGPPVPAAMRATVDRNLQPLLTPSAAAEVALLRPRLVASLAEDPAARHTVRVVGEAVYGEERFALAEWDPARPFARDLVAEGRCHARLAALLAHLPHGAQAASSLELLADTRHVAHTMVPALRAEGWDCVLADGFPHEAPALDVGWVERLRPVGAARDWFAVELGVCIAGRTIPLLPLLLQAIRDGQLVLEPGGVAATVGAGLNLRLPGGELVHVPAERVQRWLGPLVELALTGLDAAGDLLVPAAAAVPIAAAIDAPLDDDVHDRLAALLTLAPQSEGKTFDGALRPYQRLGLAWLRFLHDAGYGGLLADEMGLGKTVQVLAFLDGLRAARKLGAAAPALVVAPRSVVGNWEREAARFTPRLSTTVHVGADRAEGIAALTRAPLCITSYQTLVRDLDLFREIPWTSVVFDEAQALKNPDTRVRGAAAALRARSRFCITGTPIENHLGELWSQLDLAMPGLLGRRRAFDALFRRTIEKHGAVAPLALLRQRLRPFLLRRTKESVALDLPAKTEIVERVDLDPAQRDLYESLRLTLDAEVHEALGRAGVQGASITILDALLKLRQCCCDPRLVERAEAKGGGVSGGALPLTDNNPATSSAKLERLMAMLEELADSGRATLVFSQFTTMLALIEQECARAGISCLKLTGATRRRDAVIRRFQDGEAAVFLVSLKAGGVGLNLTRADTVIHYDPWWNPAAEAQAVGRAHRIGQRRHVLVYKLVARGTLEEAICELQDEKRQLTDAALRDGGVTHLAPEDLRALYRRLV